MNGPRPRNPHQVLQELDDLLGRVGKLEASLAPVLNTVKWECSYCQTANETPELLWVSLRYQLICRKCSNMQNYPEHIAKIDPVPPDHIKERLAKQREALKTDRVHFSQ